MTSPNTGPQPALPLSTEIPHEVWLNWRESYAAANRATEIERVLPDLDDRIATAQRELDFLKSEHKRAGRDMTEHRRRSETYREMVELWCSKHGRALPPELTPDELQPPAPTQPQAALPAGVEPISPTDPLGQGVAGQTTTRTLSDQLMEGGGEPDPGTFPPGENSDGRGEGRA